MSKKLIKNVSFRNTESEIRLMEHASSKRNFSEWVKQKLEEDMGIASVKVKAEKPADEQITINVDDNLF